LMICPGVQAQTQPTSIFQAKSGDVLIAQNLPSDQSLTSFVIDVSGYADTTLRLDLKNSTVSARGTVITIAFSGSATGPFNFASYIHYAFDNNTGYICSTQNPCTNNRSYFVNFPVWSSYAKIYVSSEGSGGNGTRDIYAQFDPIGRHTVVYGQVTEALKRKPIQQDSSGFVRMVGPTPTAATSSDPVVVGGRDIDSGTARAFRTLADGTQLVANSPQTGITGPTAQCVTNAAGGTTIAIPALTRILSLQNLGPNPVSCTFDGTTPVFGTTGWLLAAYAAGNPPDSTGGVPMKSSTVTLKCIASTAAQASGVPDASHGCLQMMTWQ
jgi:hypothetical protein